MKAVTPFLLHALLAQLMTATGLIKWAKLNVATNSIQQTCGAIK